MATYVNNLRLTELATGEGSGTWGTTTNTNLELIGEALGHGSETIANASTHTITVADGTSDSARSFYLICAGGGQACTVTLAPNTLNKVWMIENTTSATLTFTQGSGANVAVPAGHVKMIATNGAGSGAVVYDLLTDVNLAGTTTAVNLDISGDVDIDGTLNVDTLDVDGAVNFSATITMATDTKLQFRDTGIFINSSADGQLDIVADTEIQIAATTVDLNGNLDVSGTLGATGVLTANAGVVVDQLTIDGGNITSSSGGMTISGADDITVDAVGDVILSCDGDQVKFDDGTSTRFTFNLDSTPTMGMGTLTLFENEIDVSSGNLTLDVAGDIILDTDGADVRFKDAGTEFYKIRNESGVVQLVSTVSDSDIHIVGNDGGSAITALTFDMSAAGAATFNSSLTIPDYLIHAGNTSTKFGFGSANTLNFISNGTDRLTIANSYAVFNEAGSDYDFRVESNGNPNMLFVNGGTNGVGIGTSTPDTSYAFEVSGAIPAVITSTSTATTPMYGGLGVQRTTNTNGNGTGIGFILEDAGDVATEYAYIGGIIESNTGGSEDGELIIATTLNNVRTQRLRIDSSGKIVISNDIPIWSGSYGGAVFLKGNNATAARNARLCIVNSTGAQDGNKELILDNDGDVTVKGGDLIFGTAGKGIVLGATTNTAANTLDDYEEGTWTPLLSDGTNTNASYATQVGTYTKIGNSVHVQGRLTTTALGSVSGDVQIAGLPFNSANVSNAYATASFGYAGGLNISAGVAVTGTIQANVPRIAMRTWDAATGTTNMTQAEWSADGDIIFSAEYTAA